MPPLPHLRVLLVPVKPLALAKQRLAPLLTAEERQRLAHRLLEQTLRRWKELPASATQGTQLAVLTRCPLATQVAHSMGVPVVQEADPLLTPGPAQHQPLNMALQQALSQPLLQQATGMLVLPTDLPQLHPQELATLLEATQNHPVVVAPCHMGTGTNALYQQPPGLFGPQFGPQSFALHWALAQQRLPTGQAPYRLTGLPGLAHDLDTPEDWEALPPLLRQQLLAP